MTFRHLLAALAILLLGPPAAAQDWARDWDTTYGQVRLSQVEDRVYGDYAERGRIEARVSPDDDVLRGVFVYIDGRWGLIEFRRDGARKFEGQWSWDTAPFSDGRVWTGTRDTEVPSPLRYASPTDGWPTAAQGAERDVMLAFASFDGGAAAPNPTDEPRSEALRLWATDTAVTTLPVWTVLRRSRWT